MAYPAAGEPRGSRRPPPARRMLQRRRPSARAGVRRATTTTEQHTTSFSIVDRFGNAVGCTPTLGGLFGNNVVVGNTGLLLNNGMRLGSTSPYPDRRQLRARAGKIPLLNNSPVVVLKDGKLAFVFGTPGGETIGQTEFQMLVNLIDFEMPVQQAIEAPRFALDAKPNFYKPGAEITVTIEKRVPAETLKALEAMGHKLAPTSDFTAGGRRHAGDRRRSREGHDDGRRRSAAHRVRDGLVGKATRSAGLQAAYAVGRR